MSRKLHAELIQRLPEFRTVDGPGAVLVKIPEHVLPVLWIVLSAFFALISIPQKRA
jgi:hypothetical protein